jgi:arylsulfatase B
MTRRGCLLLLALLCGTDALAATSAENKSPPNIVIILIDDVGWNDLSYNTKNLSQISTPNIDKLSKTGIRLKNHYVQTTCTPTVSRLLSFILFDLICREPA